MGTVYGLKRKEGTIRKLLKICVIEIEYTHYTLTGIGIRKDGNIRNYCRCVLSKSSIHYDSMRGSEIKEKLPLATRVHFVWVWVWAKNSIKKLLCLSKKL